MSISLDIPLPEAVSFDDWACRVTEELAAYFCPMPPSEDRWQEWAASLLNINELAQANVPSAYGFADWQAWARQFVESVR